MKTAIVFARFAGAVLCGAVLVGCGAEAQRKKYPPVPVHKQLSAYNLFAISATVLKPGERVVPYKLNSALFSDYALKDRTIYIPPGRQARYRAQGVLDFPVGTIISKTFSFPADFREPDKNRRRMETRLLIHQPAGWTALPYVWNKSGTDAKLVYGGRKRAVSFLNAKGKRIEFRYAIPSKNECGSCHHVYGEDRKQVILPIGPKARHLNRDFDYGDGNVNQLRHLAKLNMLVNVPATIPRMADYNDTSKSVEERARAYLDINCAHCHSPAGSAGINSRLILTHDEKSPDKIGVCQVPGSAGKGAGRLTYDIVPGKPEESILHYRMATTIPGAMMPQLGRTLAHRAGAQLIYDWIKNMKGEVCR